MIFNNKHIARTIMQPKIDNSVANPLGPDFYSCPLKITSIHNYTRCNIFFDTLLKKYINFYPS